MSDKPSSTVNAKEFLRQLGLKQLANMTTNDATVDEAQQQYFRRVADSCRDAEGNVDESLIGQPPKGPTN